MDYQEIAKAARDQGWRVDAKKKGDMWYSPDGRTKVMWHRTPSDKKRALRNFLARMRGGGLRWPP